MRHVRPPAVLAGPRPWLFLAGSIDDGRAEPWQAACVERLADLPGTVLNPRRADWDSTWRQSIDDPRFRGQVEWELEAQERADVIAFWFASDSVAPITLLELGLFAPSPEGRRGGLPIVGCPAGYWRRGNVEVVCARTGIQLVDSFDALLAATRAALSG